MTYAILTSNRVVRGTTNDPNYQVATGESLVQVRDTFVASPYKVIELDNSVREATQAEIQQAGLDEAHNASERRRLLNALNASLDTLAADGTLPANLKDYFVNRKNLKDFPF